MVPQPKSQATNCAPIIIGTSGAFGQLRAAGIDRFGLLFGTKSLPETHASFGNLSGSGQSSGQNDFKLLDRKLNRSMNNNDSNEASPPSGGGEFAGVTHDLKNCLAVLVLVLGILCRAPDQARRRKAVEAVRKLLPQTRHLLELAESVTGGPLPQPAGPASPNVVIEQTLDGLAATLPENIRLTRWIEPGLPVLVMPPLALGRVVLNLALNARDCMSDGGEITVAAWPEEGGGHLLLTVEDTGTGIPAEVRERLFTSGLTTKPNGSGLGLATVMRLVTECGGELAVESMPGKGTRISLRLPVRQ